MAEQWKKIPGYEGLYEVSDHGSVKSLRRNIILKWRDTAGWGHHIVQLYNHDGKKWSVGIHRLMMLAFVGGGDGLEACHRDGNPANNRLDNLYWGTHQQNMRDMIGHGRHGMANRTECPSGHPYNEQNTRVKPSTGERQCRTCISGYAKRRYAEDVANAVDASGLSPNEIELLVSLRDAGWSQGKLSAEFGIRRSLIRGILRSVA